MLNRRRLMMAAVQSGGAPSEYAWLATITNAILYGSGSASFDGTATSYTGSYTFPQTGYYRIYVIGKGGDGGNGGLGYYYSSGTGAQYAASGGSGGSGGYGGCAVYDVQANSGQTFSFSYSALQTEAVLLSDTLTANAGTSGGDGEAGARSQGGAAGTAGTGGTATGGNTDEPNITGADGLSGQAGEDTWGYIITPLDGTNGANTEAMTQRYLNGGSVNGGKWNGTKAGSDGVFACENAGTVLGNPGAGGSGGAGNSASADRRFGFGGSGMPGGIVVELGQ